MPIVKGKPKHERVMSRECWKDGMYCEWNALNTGAEQYACH